MLKVQATEVRTRILKVIPATVEKMRQEGLLAQSRISNTEAETQMKILANKLTSMDVKALEKLGLSPMQLKHTPSNQLGSIIIDAMFKMPELLVAGSQKVSQQTAQFMEGVLTSAYQQKVITPKQYQHYMNNVRKLK